MQKQYLCAKINVPRSRVGAVLSEWNSAHREDFYEKDPMLEKESAFLTKSRYYQLRKPTTTQARNSRTRDKFAYEDTAVFAAFPVLRNFIKYVGDRYYDGWSELGRVFIVTTSVGNEAGRHIDMMDYFDHMHRHHFLLSSQDIKFCWDTKQTEVRQGELWVLNTTVPNWIANFGAANTRLVFDAV